MRNALAVLLAFAIPPCALAQTKAEFTSQSGVPRRLVKLNVVALNAKGDPVTDLRSTEVYVHEDGRPRHTAFFRRPGNRKMAAASAGEFANSPPPMPLVIVLDRWNERSGTMASAWFTVHQALERLESAEGIYIYILDRQGELYPVSPIPANEAELRETAQRTGATLAAMLDEAVGKLQGLRNIDQRDPLLRAKVTTEALLSLSAQMREVTGRKSLIWVTHGLPLNARSLAGQAVDFTPMVRGLSAEYGRAGIAIYAVDQSSAGAGANADLSRPTLEMLASLTGGRWFPADRIGDAIAGALTDGRANYTLSYFSPMVNNDQDHNVRVTSARKGVRFLVRSGYDGANAGPTAEQMEEIALQSARRTPFNAGEIGMRVAVSRDASKSLHFVFHLDAADVLIEPNDPGYDVHLTVMLAPYSDGFLVRGPNPFLRDLKLTQAQYEEALKNGLEIQADLPAADMQTVRAIVFDRANFTAGSVTVPLSLVR